MHGVLRSYSGKGARELFDLLASRKDEIETEMRKVKGFVSYTLMRSTDGGVSLTVCQDKAGTEDSMTTARAWLAKNATGTGVGAPVVSEGAVITHMM